MTIEDAATGPVEAGMDGKIEDFEDGRDDDSEQSHDPTAMIQEPPEGLPDKFWDAKNGEILTDTLISSYRELERRLGSPEGGVVPFEPLAYKIELQDMPGMEINEDVNTRLHAAGFTDEQAQLVYDLAAEYLPEMSAHIQSELTSEADRSRLVEEFGGESRWNETAAQTLAWGKANLSETAFESLSSTYQGVKHMQKMMDPGEPSLLRDGQGSGGPVSEEGLKALMRDPKYWRDHDPATVEQVKRGFETLYPDKG